MSVVNVNSARYINRWKNLNLTNQILERKMEEIFGFCLECNEEVEIIVEDAIIYRGEKKTEGKCHRCGAYICRISAKG